MATNRALLVAINNYGSQQNNLPSCLEDANRFRSLLAERYGFDQFTELYDGDATVANVEQGLAWLFEDVAPDDRLVFFYSGHGYQQPKGENLEECLVLGDMKFLFDDRLSELSQTAPPGVLTVVFDSCFSGGMEKQVGADGRIEIARTKAWVPPANARAQQQKSLIGRQLVPRPFGSVEVTDPAGVKRLVLGREAATPTKAAGKAVAGRTKDSADEGGQLALNGVLLSACSENETASAATSATDGMSAFTCALMGVLDAAEGELSVAELHERARAKLQELGFKQAPLLKAPSEPADLASRGFVTLASAGGETEGQEAQEQEAEGRQPAQGKSAMPAPATRPAPSTRPAPATTRPATRPAPTTRPAPGVAPGEPRPTPPRDQRATPSSGNGSTSTNATPGEEPTMNTSVANTMQPNDEKWIGLAAGLAASVVPQVIGALRRRKDFAPDDSAAAPTPTSIGNGGIGNGDAGDAEDKWVAALARVAVPAAINALPGVINAVRGKDFAVAVPATGSTGAQERGAEETEPDEKWLGLAAGLAASVVPQVIGALRRRKDFAPEPAATVPQAANGDPTDAEQKWVAALARVAVPAAINALPGLINAVRGKEAAVVSPATGNAPTSNPPMGVTEDEPDEKWLGLAAGLAASVVPQVIGALRRRKDFEPEPAATVPQAANGDAADAEQKWVVALARVAVPAAINALPGVISAIRGRKDVVPYPAPAPAQQRSIEGFAADDEKILRAVAPAIAEAMRDHRYRVAI